MSGRPRLSILAALLPPGTQGWLIPQGLQMKHWMNEGKGQSWIIWVSSEFSSQQWDV